MVRRAGPFLLLALGALLSPSSAAMPRALRAEEPEPSPASAGEGGDRPGEPLAPPAPTGEGQAKAPEPPGSREDKSETGAVSGPEDEGLEIRILELEHAIWMEIEVVDARLERIKERLGALRGAAGRLRIERRFPDLPPEGRVEKRLPGPRPAAKGAPPGANGLVASGEDVFFFSTVEEEKYDQLLRRQDDVLRRWRRVPSSEARGPRRAPLPAGEKEREMLRDELRIIVTEILEVREKARGRQIEGLRREIADIERAIEFRKNEVERKRLIEGRVEELLGARPRSLR